MSQSREDMGRERAAGTNTVVAGNICLGYQPVRLEHIDLQALMWVCNDHRSRPSRRFPALLLENMSFSVVVVHWKLGTL